MARTLAPLEADQVGGVTIAALRERGVKAPVQAVYTLQPAGYQIEHSYLEDANGKTALGYPPAPHVSSRGPIQQQSRTRSR